MTSVCRASIWRTRRFDELLSYEQPTRYLVRSSDYATSGRYPVLTAGKTFVLGYTNEAEGAYTDHPVIIFDDFTTSSKYVDFDFKVKSSAMKMLRARAREANLRFVYERMQLIDYPVFDHKRRWISEFGKLEVEAPELEEQEAIAEVADHLSAYTTALERLIAKKQAIKQGMMQELLTGKTRLPGFSGPWKPVSVGSVLVAGFSGPSPTCEERSIQGDEWGVLKTTCSTWERGWDWHRHKRLPRVYWGREDSRVLRGDTVITKAGPRHRVGVPAFVDDVPERIIPSGKMICLRPNTDQVHPPFLALALSDSRTQAHLKQRTTGMAESQENFENDALMGATIYLPTVDEQRAIATVLSDADDEVDALRARLAKAKAIKQGMMQELLTGRTRLPVSGNTS